MELNLNPLIERLGELRDVPRPRRELLEDSEMTRLQTSQALEGAFKQLYRVMRDYGLVLIADEDKAIKLSEQLAAQPLKRGVLGGMLRTGVRGEGFIYLHPNLSLSGAFKILAHELGHYLNVTDLPHRESEALAEGVSFALCQFAGYDSTEFSALYLREHGIRPTMVRKMEPEIRRIATELWQRMCVP